MAAPKGNKYNASYSQKDIDIIIEDLLEWAHSGEGVYICSYIYETYKKPDSWIYNLSRYHDDLKEALELTRRLLSGKIARYCMYDKKYGTNASFGEKILPMYCEDYKANLKWKEDIKQKELTEQEASIIVKAVNYAKNPEKQSTKKKAK